jgi:hypothetical protein
MTRSRPVVAAFAVLLLIASACSDDDGSVVAAPEDETTTSAAEADDTTTPAESDDTADDAGDDEPMELFASDTGVTAETIKIGAVFPDTTTIGREPGDIEAKWQVAVDAVNAAGGINGRMLELVFDLYAPIGDVEIERLCTEHVEDEEVFATIGLFLRESVLCWTDIGDTIAINTFPVTPEQIERSSAPLISVDALSSRLVEDKIETLIEAGHLEPGAMVAVLGVIGDEELHELYITALEERGIDVVSKTLRTTENDLAGGQAEMDLIGQRWIADGAEIILGSVPESGMDIVRPYTTAGLELLMLLPENTHVTPSLIQEFTGNDLSAFDFAVALIGDVDNAQLYERDEAGVRECVDRFETATGEVVSLDTAAGAGDNLDPTVMACQSVKIFTLVAAAAGVDLTTESFAAAAEAFGPIEVTGVLAGSLGPDKFDVSDTPAEIATFDAVTQTFVVS